MVRGGKKKGVKAKKADPIVPVTQSRQTVEISNNSTSLSQQLECAYCDVEDEEDQWFVQCDGCKKKIHFTCAGITQIEDEDPWSCRACQPEAIETSQVNTNMEQTNIQSSECGYCKAPIDRSKGFLECDTCKQQSHYSCVRAISEACIYFPWTCQKCESVVGQEKMRSSHNESKNEVSSKVLVTTGVHTHSSAILEDIPERSEKLAIVEEGREQTVHSVQPFINPAVEIRDLSKSSRSKCSHSRTVSSSSSIQRRELELRRLNDELNLQAELDEKTLALQIEALKMYENRQKKYLDGKYKALSVGDGSIASKRSSKSSKTQRSSYVEEWIQKQQNQINAPKRKSVDEKYMRSLQRFDEKIDHLILESSTLSEIHKPKPKSVDKNAIRNSSAHRNHEIAKKAIHHVPILQDYHHVLQNEAAAVKFPQRFRSQQEILDDQVQKFITWQNEDTRDPRMMKIPYSAQAQQLQLPIHSVEKENLMKSHPTHQLHRDSFVTSKGSEFASNSRSVNWQQPKFPVPQEENKIHMHPESQSMFLRPQSTSMQGHENQINLDSQTNLTYVFSKNSQRVNPTVTPSNHMNQSSSTQLASRNHNQPISSASYYYEDPQILISCSANQPMVTSPPINSKIENTGYGYENLSSTLNGKTPLFKDNTGYENQYYDQLYSFHHPVNSSAPQSNVHYGQWTPMSSNSASSSNLIISSMASINTSSNGSRNFRASLVPSQIAARHAFPKELPIFTGNPKDWRRFIKRFDNSTSMCGYSDDENLERLDKCLKGKARILVESLLLMPDCVPEIIDTLKEKYGRPELIIKALLKELKEFPKIKPEKLESLSDYGYSVRNACKQIEDMKMINYLCNPDLIQDIIDKLPHQTLIEWARYSQYLPSLTLRTLSDWLYNLSRTLNRITTPEIPTVSSDQKGANAGKNDDKSDNSSKIGYVYFHENKRPSTREEQPSKCAICGKDCKLVENCPKFTSSNVNEKWNLIFEKRLCKRCLKFHKQRCHISKACGVNGCEFKHHSLLHNEERYSKEKSGIVKAEAKSTEPNDKKSGKLVKSGRNNSHHQGESELYRIVPVDLFAENQKVTTYAYLDEGSSFTLMERQVADKLGIKGTPETICLLWTNNVHRQEESEVVDLEISASNSKSNNEPSKRYKLNNVNVVQELSLPEQSLPIDEFKQRYKHLCKIPIAGYENVVPTMLIGIKHAKLAVPLQTIECDTEEDQPIATRSRLGWSVYGPVGYKSSGYVNTHRIVKCPCQERDEEVHKLIKDHFTIENFGVVAKNASLDSKENVKALKMLEDITVRKENRFETGLLWKNDVYKMPDSYGMARKRLECLENKGPKVINVINEAVEDYVKKGYVHKPTQDELAEDRKRIWYLPLFTVVHPKKPEKLRTVFDAAAKVKGVSLSSRMTVFCSFYFPTDSCPEHVLSHVRSD